ncbi:MAG: DUF1569 domain-containing protein [Candidatus Eisenbacteria bacterium]
MALCTLLNETDRARILDRLRRVRKDSAPAWGTLTAPRMLCHLGDQMRVALGDAPTRPTHNLLTRLLLKNLVVNTGMAAPRGKVQTAPEMLLSAPSSWDEDLATCLALAERVARGEARAVHPAFGPLSSAEWGRLCYKHLDHHLTQFGA